MAEIAAAVAPVPSMVPAKSKTESKQNKFAQWAQVLLAEAVSAWVPVRKIDDDPLLTCW